MNKQIPPHHEDHPDHEIRATLRGIQLPAVDMDALAETMRSEMHGQPTVKSTGYSWLPAFAKAAIVLTGLCTVYMFYLLTTTTSGVNGYEIASQTGGGDPSWMWRWKLERGYTVTIPDDSTVELTLADDSILKCRGGTTVSVQYGKYRTINIDNGWIEVHAAKNPDYPMRVNTPLGNVHVTGTVFQVEVIR